MIVLVTSAEFTITSAYIIHASWKIYISLLFNNNKDNNAILL